MEQETTGSAETVQFTDSKKSKWYMDQDGNVSSIRIMAMLGAIIGGLVMLSAVGLSFCATFLQRWEVLQAVSIMLPAGAGLMATGELAKVWQAKNGL